MRQHLAALAVLAALGGPALAQTTVTGQPATGGANSATTPGQSAVTRPNTDQPASTGAVPAASLQPGANSFTEGQVRGRLEQAGIKDVHDLKKDDQGIWRGQATREGKTVSVGFDFKGNVAVQ